MRFLGRETNMSIQHNRPTIGKEEIKAATRVLESAHIAAGSECRALEAEFVDRFFNGEGDAVALSSGSAALRAALLSNLDVSNATYVIPVYSCSAIPQAILQTGGTYIPIDCLGPGSWKIDYDDMKDHDVIYAIGIHPFGLPMLGLDEVASHPNLIEDCCQAIGTRYDDGTYVGSKGGVGIFSFSPTKPITCGGYGGLVYSTYESKTDHVALIQDYDSPSWDKDCPFNCKMSDVNAAIARVQLKRIDEFINRREQIYKQYVDVVNKSKNKAFYTYYDSFRPSGYTMYYRALIGCKRGIEKPLEIFARHDIEAIQIIRRDELLSYKDLEHYYPHALYTSETCLSIPLYPTLTDEEVERVCEALRECLEY